jgi:hypothetical protein
MRPLLRLANGTRLAHTAVRAIDARELSRPHVDRDGREWPAMVVIETRNQILRVPCASFAEALAMRDELGADVDALLVADGNRRRFSFGGAHGEEAEVEIVSMDSASGGRLPAGESPEATRKLETVP